MRRILCAIILLASMKGYSQQLGLSEQSEISVITLGPDQDDLVQAFGHSAIRVYDPALGIDYAYNYGVFSFNQPNFFLNFARGHNYYYVGIASYPEFREVYVYYNRYVHEQVLNLTRDQKQRVFAFLQWNAQPENRNYLYDYFYNNCSTKIRDVLADVLKNEIQFDGSFVKTGPTIRQLTDPYLKTIPWGDLGIDLGLGSLIDQEATPYEYMYLPEYLETSLDHASIIKDGAKVPLVKINQAAFVNTPQPPERSLIHPWVAFGALFMVAAALSVWDFRRNKLSRWFDAILLITVGLVGVVLFLLWTATDHHACARNYNLLWALPTHLVAVVFLLKKNRPGWLKSYFMASAVICGLLLVLWPILPQNLNNFMIPVVGALLVRGVTIFKLPTTAA